MRLPRRAFSPPRNDRGKIRKMWVMGIEFATSIEDYKFPDIPEKMFKALKQSMINTLFCEKVPVFAVVKSRELLNTQTYWSLI